MRVWFSLWWHAVRREGMWREPRACAETLLATFLIVGVLAVQRVTDRLGLT